MRIHRVQCSAVEGAIKDFRVVFPTGRESATFRDKVTEVPSLSRDKGTTGQAKNLAKGRDSQNPGRDAGQNRTEQKRTF